MNDPRMMTTEEIYRTLRQQHSYDKSYADQLVDFYYRASAFLVDRIANDGWKWSDNFLREYVRCRFKAKFSNTISPYVNELLFRQHPDLRKYANQDSEEKLL